MRIKSLLVFALALFFLASFGQELLATEAKLIGTVHRIRLNVRSKPRSKARKLSTLRKGQKVTVLGKSRNKRWYKVRFKTSGNRQVTGWANTFGLTVKKLSKAKAISKLAKVNRPRLNVRTKPSSKGRKIFTLKRGKVVKVLRSSKNGKWYKVSFKGKSGKKYSGWANTFGLVAVKAKKPVVKVAPPPPAQPTLADDYFAEGRAPAAAPTAPQVAAKKAPAVPQEMAFEDNFIDEETAFAAEKKAAPPKLADSDEYRAEEYRQDDSESILSETKIIPRLGLGFFFTQYKLNGIPSGSATSSKILSYNLPGFGVDLGADLYFLELPPGKSNLGLSFNYQFGYFKYQVGLQDSSAAALTARDGKENKSGTSNKLTTLLLYRFNLAAGELPPQFIFHAGYEYYKFSAGDLEGDLGPLFLVVDQKITSFPLGFEVTYPFDLGKPLISSLFFDYYLMPKYSEGSTNPSGSDPSEGMFIKFGLGFDYRLLESLSLDMRYSWQMMKVDFTGAGRRIMNDFTGAKATINQHAVSFGAKYHF